MNNGDGVAHTSQIDCLLHRRIPAAHNNNVLAFIEKSRPHVRTGRDAAAPVGEVLLGF